MTTDRELHNEIDALIDEEHTLRSSGGGLSDDQRQRLTFLEQHLDTLWDLVLRRQAARDAGKNPDEVPEPSVDQVENYLQ
jgi:Protein of unknown function (DUF2630)